MFPISWAVAFIGGVVALVGVLVVTGDLDVTNDVFKDGVVQAKIVDATHDDALVAADELPAAKRALESSMPEVTGTLGQLGQAQSTLGTLGKQLDKLARVLASADHPLGDIIGSVEGATGFADRATPPAANIVKTLGLGNSNIKKLGPLLDETSERSARIEAKLRVLRAIPKLPR